MTQAREIENIPLRNGIDFDLVNISLLGFDPVSGRSFEECSDEWLLAARRVQAAAEKLRWWDIPGRFRIARQSAIISQREGLHGFILSEIDNDKA